MDNVGKTEKCKAAVIYNGRFVPVELLWACNIHAICLCRKKASAAEDMLGYVLRFMNPLVRSFGGILLEGDYGEKPCCFLQQTDNHVVRMTEILHEQGIPVTEISVPAEDEKPEAVQYYIEEVLAVKAFLEKQYRKTICIDELLEKVKLTNRIHHVLEEISVLRKADFPSFHTSDFFRLQHKMFSEEPEEAILSAEAFWKEKSKIQPGIPKAEADMCSVMMTEPLEKPVRILLMGRVAAENDELLTDCLEQTNCAVVFECLDEGVWPWELTFDIEDFTIESYARQRYLKGHCVNHFHHSFHRRYEYIKGKCLEYRGEGIIWYQLSFDEIYDMEYECLSKWCDQDGISLLRVESSYECSLEEMAALATRVESFVQMLRDKRNER